MGTSWGPSAKLTGAKIVTMPLPIHVDACSGWRANERPRAFVLDERYVIIAVEDCWYSPDAKFFKVRALDEESFTSCATTSARTSGRLESTFDGAELCARPSTQLVTVTFSACHAHYPGGPFRCGSFPHRSSA